MCIVTIKTQVTTLCSNAGRVRRSLHTGRHTAKRAGAQFIAQRKALIDELPGLDGVTGRLAL